jgi:hypothetical protein
VEATIAESHRYQAKIDRTGDCWTWTGAKDRDGYGWHKVGRQMRYAHRLAAEAVHGPIPSTILVCHHCDNPSCVRPDHLFLGSAADNSADMVAKGRQICGDAHWARAHPERLSRGSNNPAARLREDQVDLAATFAVSQPLISQIVRRVSWAHLEAA